MAIAEQGRPLVRHGRVGPFAETRVDIPAHGSIPRVPAGSSVVLPGAADGREKYAYVRRHTWMLTLCTVLTFPPLVYSQIRLFAASPWFLLYAPFMVLGTVTFLVSLLADGIRRGVRPGRAPEDGGGWRPLPAPVGRRVPAHLRRADRTVRNSWTHVAALRAT